MPFVVYRGVVTAKDAKRAKTAKMNSVAVAEATVGARAPVRTKTTFYVALSAFMVGVMVAGFWPTYFGRLLRGDIARPLVVQIQFVSSDGTVEDGPQFCVPGAGASSLGRNRTAGDS